MAYTHTTSSKEVHSCKFVKTIGASVTTHDMTTSTVWTDFREGEKMPNYKSKIAAGQQAATPYRREATKYLERGDGYLLATYKDAYGRPGAYIDSVTGNACSAGPTLDVPAKWNTAKAEAVALSKIYKKIESELSHLNSAAVVAEFADVVRQFGSPFSAMVSLHHRHLNRLYLEKRRLSGSTSFKRVKLLEIAAQTWLEMSFGLLPLINDTKQIAEAIRRWQDEAEEEVLQKLRSRIMSRAAADEVELIVQPVTNLNDQIFSSLQRTRKTSWNARCQYVVGLQGSLETAYGSNDRLIEILGFKPGDFIPAAWEVVPWSWLVDYFTNIQEILQAGVTSTARVSWIVKTITRRAEYYETIRPTGKLSTGVVVLLTQKTHPKYGLGMQKVVLTKCQRTIPASLGVPPLYFEHPFEDWRKLANMASVLMARRASSANALWLW